MKRIPGVGFLTLVIFLQTATAQHIYRDFDTAVSLAQYKSFARADYDLFEPASAREGELNKFAAKAVERQLANRKLTTQDAEKADLLLASYVFTKDRRYPLALGYDESQLGINSDIRRWQFEGNVVVDLIDNKTNRVVWRGVAMRALNKPEKYEEQLDKTVAKLFEKYPASRRGFTSNYRRQQIFGVLFAVGVLAFLRLAIR